MPPPHTIPPSPPLHSVWALVGAHTFGIERSGLKCGVAHPTHFKRCEHGYSLNDFQRRNTNIVDE